MSGWFYTLCRGIAASSLGAILPGGLLHTGGHEVLDDVVDETRESVSSHIQTPRGVLKRRSRVFFLNAFRLFIDICNKTLSLECLT